MNSDTTRTNLDRLLMFVLSAPIVAAVVMILRLIQAPLLTTIVSF